MPRRPRSTPQGEHRPVLLEAVLAALAPRPGEVMVDCTLGFAGHAVELLQRLGPTGRLIGLDLDAEHLPRARERLQALGLPFEVRHSNFAGLPGILAELGLERVDGVLADLGMSSMQVDDSQRGFSYAREGPLDMRMDRSRGRTAAQILATISEEELCAAMRDFGDEPEPERVARLIVNARQAGELRTTADLSRLLLSASQPGWRLHPRPGQWNLHPAARTFQALRILVNRELNNLDGLLRLLPAVLRPGGRAVLISFHSGEDRLVKRAFREGLQAGLYEKIAAEPERASFPERQANPRSRSAKLRWAVRASA
jgi:16S rRNA (cytosine1402-N4)-methyltransferase